MKLFIRKINNIKRQYIFVTVTITLFAVTVAVLNRTGYVSSKNTLETVKKNASEQAKRTLIPLVIKNTNISGMVMFVKDGNLSSYDPVTKITQPIVTGMNIAEASMLEDGRLYFWQKENNLYDVLFIQKDQGFERYRIPLELNDGGSGPLTSPLLLPDGKKILFTSDRDAQDGYKRRALYEYSLETYVTDKITDNKILNIYTPFISNDNSYIGFTYQNLEENKGAVPTALGIIETSTRTINLFPNVMVGSLMASFAGEYIVYTGQEGVSTFELNKGKIGETIGSGTVINISRNGLIAVWGEPNESKQALIENCQAGPDQQKLPPAGELLIYKIEKGGLKQVASLASSDYIIRFPAYPKSNLFSDNNKRMLVDFQDKTHCRITKGILDIASQTITPIEDIGTEQAFWSYDKTE